MKGGSTLKRHVARFMLIVVIALLLQVSVLATEDGKNIKVYLNNIPINFEDKYGYPYMDAHDRVMVPLRLTLEKFGAKVSWNAKDQVAMAQKGDVLLEIPIGQKFFLKNGEIIINESETILKASRTYLPIRAVMEAFGCIVTWSDMENSVFIDYKKGLATIINTVPAQYDLRNFGKVTGVKDQEAIGACWAFSTLGAIESALLPREKHDFSEDHLSLTHGYNVSQNQGGDFNIAMSYLARWDGPVLEAEDPYGDGVANLAAKPYKHVQEAIVIPSKNYLAIKLSLLLHGGVQTSMYFDASVIKPGSTIYNGDTHAFYYKGNAKINHAVVIVGWDDRFPKENFATVPDQDGAFICKNSYGTEFGEKGYFYVSYSDKYIGTENYVFTKIESTTNYAKIYQTDQLGWVGRLGYGSDTAYFANVYTTKSEKENLEAVSFYATDVATDYEVYYVNNFNNTLDFKDMKLLKRGSLDYKGYYTIDFEQPILVSGRFGVIVKIKTPGSSLPVAAEYYKSVTWLDAVDITDGEGYMSQKGHLWDSTEKDYKSNVCLKAFTSISK